MMNDIVEGLCLMLAACAVACCFGYFKGWCCDGGIIKSEFQSKRNRVEKKIRKQIKKMVAAEEEIKRLAVIATLGTEEDPGEYVAKIRNLLYPVPDTVPSSLNPAGEADHLGRPTRVTIITGDDRSSWPIITSDSDLEMNDIDTNATTTTTNNTNFRLALNPTTTANSSFTTFPPHHHYFQNEPLIMNTHAILELQDYGETPPYSYINPNPNDTTGSTSFDSNTYNIGNDEPPSYEQCMRGMQYV